MRSSEILNSAADTLEQKEWLQHVLARDADGEIVMPEDRRACAFCLLGALWHSIPKGNQNGRAAKDAISRALGVDPHNNKAITRYNDDPKRTKAEVIAILREAARQEIAAGR